MNILSTQYGPIEDSQQISKILLLMNHPLATDHVRAHMFFNPFYEPMTDCSHFTEEHTEARRGWVTCPRSLNLKEADPGFELNLWFCFIFLFFMTPHTASFWVVRLDSLMKESPGVT